jgi:hypothetical protein
LRINLAATYWLAEEFVFSHLPLPITYGVFIEVDYILSPATSASPATANYLRSIHGSRIIFSLLPLLPLPTTYGVFIEVELYSLSCHLWSIHGSRIIFSLLPLLPLPTT